MSPRLRYTIAALVLLVGAGALFHASGRQVRTAAAGALLASSAAPASAEKPEPKPAAAMPTASKTEFASGVASVSPQVHRVLPELKYPVSDWRAYAPEKLTVAPHPDLPMEFEMKSVRYENGRTIWKGRNALQGAFLVAVATETEWHAVLEVPASSGFEIHIAGQSARVIETADAGVCGNMLAAMDRPAHATLSGSEAPSAPNAQADAPGAHVVDVLFFYDSATLAYVGSAAAIESTIIGRIDSCNAVLENSGVDNFRWRYVGAYQVPRYTYSGSPDLEEDLERISYTDNVVGRFVAEKSSHHGADQSVMYVTGDHEIAGIAWVPGRLGQVAHHAAVLWRDTYSGYQSNYQTLAHELAHNFGCRHNRDQDALEPKGARDDDGHYWYGYVLGDSVSGVPSDLRGRGTIMAYANNRIPYFSNPDVSYRGNPTGLPDDHPRAADNARVLRATADEMAGYRAANDGAIPPRSNAPASSSSGNGGGGGGGAVGDLYMIALATLALIRMVARSARNPRV